LTKYGLLESGGEIQTSGGGKPERRGELHRQRGNGRQKRYIRGTKKKASGKNQYRQEEGLSGTKVGAHHSRRKRKRLKR